MKITPSNAQHIGKREEQQDALGMTGFGDEAFLRHGGALAVVCDGMGGMEHGAEASAVAVQTFVEMYERKSEHQAVPYALGDALAEANATVHRLAQERGEEGAVGTTLIAAVVHEEALHWVSVGDSRIYLWRGGQLTQLTRDHVLAADLAQDVARGQLSRTEAEGVERPDALTSHLGMPTLPAVDCSVQALSLRDGDRVLLCTDGVHGSLKDSDIAACLTLAGDQGGVRLVERVLGLGLTRQDNLSAVVLNCDAETVPDTQTRSVGTRAAAAGRSANEEPASAQPSAGTATPQPSAAATIQPPPISPGTRPSTGGRAHKWRAAWVGVAALALAAAAAGAMLYGSPLASSEHGATRASEIRAASPVPALGATSAAPEPAVEMQDEGSELPEADLPPLHAPPASGRVLSAEVADDVADDVANEHQSPKQANPEPHHSNKRTGERRKAHAARRAREALRAPQEAKEENIKMAPWESK